MMCCYYPTATVVVDDDINFLNKLAKYSGIANCIIYSSSKKAIDVLLSQQSLKRIESRIIRPSISANNDCLAQENTIAPNIRALHEDIYNSNRFQDVSVIVVDYYMEDINGIELCKQLAKHPAKKILLTRGVDKAKIAIDAFNKGIINQFISKNDKYFPSKLKQTIELLRDEYFKDFSATVLPHITLSAMTPHEQSMYMDLLNNLKKQNNIVEYYMLDNMGTSLMINADGDLLWCILKHEAEIEDYLSLAIAQEAPAHLIQGLTKRLLMPFFLSDDDYQQPVTEWSRFFHLASSLPGCKNYYYSIYKGYQNMHIDKNKIASYASYLKSLSMS